jgi:hypothetical protein
MEEKETKADKIKGKKDRDRIDIRSERPFPDGRIFPFHLLIELPNNQTQSMINP